MKKLVAVLVVLVVGGGYFYHTNWFQSFFLYERFYERIFDAPFDVTIVGTRISIPLIYNYKTCYDLGVAVPGRELSDSGETGKGRLGYMFVSSGKVLASGVTQPIVGHGWSGDDEISIRPLLVFDLPVPGSSEELVLELEVLEPFSFLAKFNGPTSIVINPDYDAKLGRCINEDLRIKQPE